jgi:hypothetical protein
VLMCAAHVHGPRGPCACTTHAVPRSNWRRHVGEARSKGGHANSRRALGYLHLAIDYGAGGRRAPRILDPVVRRLRSCSRPRTPRAVFHHTIGTSERRDAGLVAVLGEATTAGCDRPMHCGLRRSITLCGRSYGYG